jgi:predicted metal-dependent hydrolase
MNTPQAGSSPCVRGTPYLAAHLLAQCRFIPARAGNAGAEKRFHPIRIAQKLADKHRMPLRGLLVKSQRTRWASCSAQKNLSLNTKLLFLSPDLVRYVLIHELCHTVYMDHSKEFWRFVASHEPGYKILDQELREAWKTVPDWMF